MTSKPSARPLATGIAAILLAGYGPVAAAADRATSYVVESDSAVHAAQQVAAAHGHVTRSLPIIHGVAARLTAAQLRALERRPGVTVYADRAVHAAAKATKATNSPGIAYSASTAAPAVAAEVGATALQQAGITGKGVTIAVLDTGFTPYAAPYDYDAWGSRILATVDFAASNGGSNVADGYGHGTQVTSIAGSAATDSAGSHYGIAPGANFVIVRAFDASGNGSYSNVISGLNWIVANKAKYNIRVVNLSLGATPTSYYWNDPLAQAVMQAWASGIVVVAAAGNGGPAAQTIGVPGNVPYVITVGAWTDQFLQTNQQGALTTFSSTGPTIEGFVKPEVVAPGGHIMASMPNDQTVATTLTTQIFGSVGNPTTLFPLTGTSQSAAVTSGVVALLLQSEPTLTPDEVKCKLIATAQPGVQSNGKLIYSVFQQGAGLISAVNAAATSATGCANQGLNIAADLAGTAHFGGRANQDSKGNYYIMAMSGATPTAALSNDGYTWSGGAYVPPGHTHVIQWSQSYVWQSPYSWSVGYVWQGASAAPATASGAALTPDSNKWAQVKSIVPTTKTSAASAVAAPYPAAQE